MSRIASTFARLQANGEKGLVTFITAGDPTVSTTVPSLGELADNGADILELGVPFTDPEADGPSIQRSSERALRNGVTLRSTCEMVADFRERNATTPIVLMGYFNPIVAIGVESFAQLAHDSGVDGLIVVNLPPEESDRLNEALKPFEIDLVLLIAPTTPKERIAKLAEKGSGFLYYVSIKGVTGANHLDVQVVAKHVEAIKAITELPVAVGFGIKTPEIAAAVAKTADAVVVGSALVDIMGAGEDLDKMLPAMRTLTSSIKTAVRSG